MAKTKLQGRAVPANRLSTWRTKSALYEGRALGPYVIDDVEGGFAIRRADSVMMGTLPTFAEAYAEMARLAAQWEIDCQPWVYFIGEVLKPGRYVKIGTALNVEKRLKQLQAYSPAKLVIFAKVPGDAQDEATHHAKWARFRAHNEWFRLTPKMCAEIAHLTPILKEMDDRVLGFRTGPELD